MMRHCGMKRYVANIPMIYWKFGRTPTGSVLTEKGKKLMDETKLKPCPFCGRKLIGIKKASTQHLCGGDVLYFVVDNNTNTVEICCNWCKEITTLEENEWEGDTASAKTRAEEAWNGRANDG